MAFWGPCSLTFFQCCLWAVRCHHSHSTTCICPLCKPSESSPYLYHFKILVSRCWALTHSYSLKSNLSMTGIFLVLLLGIISYSPVFSFPVLTVTWMLDWIFNVFFFFFFLVVVVKSGQHTPRNSTAKHILCWFFWSFPEGTYGYLLGWQRTRCSEESWTQNLGWRWYLETRSITVAPFWAVNGVVAMFQFPLGLLSPRLGVSWPFPWFRNVLMALIYIAADVTTIL